jgi:hypothetical protein
LAPFLFPDIITQNEEKLGRDIYGGIVYVLSQLDDMCSMVRVSAVVQAMLSPDSP